MRDERDLEVLIQDCLAGRLDAAAERDLAERLERDPEALARYVDQLQMHQRLGVILKDGDPVSAPVLREIRLLDDSPRFSREVVDRVKESQGVSSRRGRFMATAAAAIFVAAVLFYFTGIGTQQTAGPGGRVLFVVGRMPPGPGDAAVRERLVRMGCAVTLRPADRVEARDAEGHELVLISSTVRAQEVVEIAGDLRNKFRETPVPLITWEPRLLYDLGMISGGVHKVDWAATRGQTRLVIGRPDHPLAAGRKGAVTAVLGIDQFSWGRARPDAVKVASLEGEPDKAAIFGYEKGAVMPGLVAPARRVGFFLFDTTSTQLNDDGWALFEAAVHWCKGANP